MARIHMLEIKLRGIPENLSPIETKRAEIQHSLQLMTALFRGIGLMSFEQANLHFAKDDVRDNFTRIEELDRAMELIGELGAGISDFACGSVETLVELVSAKN